jgi:GH25 family lysozyme M1 (1,4-beta-N-acetylmuramidase)
VPRRVIDIYHVERGIDLAAWKSRHNTWGVIVKCGGSDDNHWNRYEETTYVQQYTQAKGLGLHVGAYYYSDALTASDALEDAKHCVNDCLRGLPLDLPVYLDIEEPSQLNLPMHVLTDVVTTFCDHVRRAGYDVGIYSGYYGFRNMSESKIADYSLWVAAWRTSWPIWAKDYDLWQEGSMSLDGRTYHEDGEVDGAGKVDLDWASDAFVARVEGGYVGKKINPAEVAALIHYDMVTDPRNG